MKKLTFFGVALSALVLMQGCQNNTKDSKKTADSANAVKDTTSKDTAQRMTINVSKNDAQFAVEAASGGMTEVILGKLAMQKASNQAVKDFGTMMVTDHSKANNALTSLAKSKNITLPTVPDEKDRKVINMLSKKTGKDFDKAYTDDMVDDHKNDIKEFDKEAKNGADADVKAFAAKTLPVLKTHLDAINKVHQTVN